MSTLVSYNGLMVVSPDPTGPGGLAINNNFKALFNQAVQPLTDAASIAWNLADGGNATVSLGGNRTLANPTNIGVGGTYSLQVTQDATGSRTLGYGTAFRWPGGVAPVLSTAPGAVDVLRFISFDGATLMGMAENAYTLSPASIPGLQLWLKADTGVLNSGGTPCTNGQNVATWKDQSGSGNDAVPVTLHPGNTPPTFVTSAINGLPALSFAASGSYGSGLVTPLTTNFGDFSVFCVAVQATAGVISGEYVRLVDKLYSSGFWTGWQDPTIGTNFGSGVLEASLPFGIYLSAANGVPHTFASIRSGTTHTINVDSSSTSNTVSGTACDSTPVSVGCDNNGTQNFTGYIAEVLVFNSALTLGNVAQIMTYLREKWG